MFSDINIIDGGLNIDVFVLVIGNGRWLLFLVLVRCGNCNRFSEVEND